MNNEITEKDERFPDAVLEISDEFTGKETSNISIAIFERLNGSKEDQYIWTPTGYKGVSDELRYGEFNVDCLQREISDGTFNEKAFLFCVADCAFPPTFLCFGSSFADAYDGFINTFSAYIEISEEDLPDYGDEIPNYSDNGKPLDTESIQGFELKLIELKFS